MEVGPGQDRDEALSIATRVVPEAGQWAVYAEIAFPDVVKRFHLGTFRTERRAQIHATYIRRYADLPPGFGGLGF
ncbi:MAG: AP2 domain-containing protein [Bacteroidota bacterium]